MKYSFVAAVLVVPYVLFLAFVAMLVGLDSINPTTPGTHWEWRYGEDLVQIVRVVTMIVFVPLGFLAMAIAVHNRKLKSRKVAWSILAIVFVIIGWSVIVAQLTSSQIVEDAMNTQNTNQLRVLELKINN